MYLIHKRAPVRRHYQRERIERGVSTGFTNPIPIASKLRLTKIKPLKHSRAFTYRFWRVQALPLSQLRFLCPRNGRGLDAECPRHSPASRPWPCPVRVRVRSENSPCPRPNRVRDMPADVSVVGPCPGRDRPRPVRSRAQSMTASSPCSWKVRDRVESGEYPGHGCIASALRTIHLQTLSAHVRI